MSEPYNHTVSTKTYVVVFAVLMILLVLTVAAAQIPNPLVNIVVAITIATTKAILILLYFMHLRFSSSLTRVFAAAGFVWLVLLLGLISEDYLSRDWLRGDLGTVRNAGIDEPSNNERSKNRTDTNS